MSKKIVDINKYRRLKSTDELVWKCGCGSTEYYLMIDGVKCTSCEEKNTYEELFDVMST